jgi:hypothetical protein
MNKTIILTMLFVVGVVAIGAVFMRGEQTQSLDKVVVYKTATCGCCGVYTSYLKREGYDVEINTLNDLTEIKRELGVPHELMSCHTSKVAGYVVEGHIPEEAIAKLLAEKPDIKGIGMAGMPIGSPGMPGPKEGPFVIYEITNDGTQGDVFITL